MEKKIEITEKQLQFLQSFIDKKYSNLSPEVKIELIDHLVCDFEEAEEDNISQYLSNEISFIQKFINSRVSNVKKTYSKQTWNQFFSFFTTIKLLPITVFSILIIGFLSKNFNDRTMWILFGVSTNLIILISAVFGMINKKSLRKLDEVKYLGAEIWLPFLMFVLPDNFWGEEWLLQHKIVFVSYWLFAFIYGVSAYLVLRKQRKFILNKYKALIN